MKPVTRLFNYYLDASIHAGLAVSVLLWPTTLFFSLPWDPHLFLFVFFGTIACYNFVKYGVEAQKYILIADRYHRQIQAISIACLLAALYQLRFLNGTTLWAIGILSVISALYAIPVLPGPRNLRSLGGFKIVPVALVWAGTSVILPVLATGMYLGWDVWVEVVQRFLFVLVLMIPFEIRDMAYDPLELRTLPQVFGVGRAKIFGALLVIPFFFATFLKDDFESLEIVGKGLVSLLLLWVLYVTGKKQSRYFASFWVESVPLVWAGFLWVVARII